MRYRVTFDQVMNTWYVTIRLDEPDGSGFSKSVGHYQIDVSDEAPMDLAIMLRRLANRIG